MTNEKLRLIPRLTINDGAVQAFTDVLARCCEAVEANEPGTLTYEFYIGGTVCQGLEFFESSDALLRHIAGPVGTDFMPELLALASLDSIAVYGEPSPQAAEVLSQLGATLHGRPAIRRRTAGTATARGTR